MWCADAKSNNFFNSLVTMRVLRTWQIASPGRIQDVSAMAHGGQRFSTMCLFS